MPKATKEKPGNQTVETADQTDDRPVETGSQPDKAGEGADAGKARSAAEEYESLLKKTEQAKTELASIQKGREIEEEKLSQLREESRIERASREGTANADTPEPTTPQSQPSPASADEDYSTVEGWQRHIDRATEQKMKPVVKEFEAFKQSSRKKAIREFMSKHPEYRGGDDKRFTELMSVADRNGFKETYHAEDALDVLEGSWAFVNRETVLAKARATDGAAAATEDAALDTVSGGSPGREGSPGAGAAQASDKDRRAAVLAKMPVDKYLKLKKQAEEQGFFIEAPSMSI